MKYPITLINIIMIVIFMVIFNSYLFFSEYRGGSVITELITILMFSPIMLSPHILFIILACKSRGTDAAFPVLITTFIALGASILMLKLMSDDITGARFLVSLFIGWVGCLICWGIKKSLTHHSSGTS